MGQAERKAAGLAAWESSLTANEKIVANTARRLHAKFVKPLTLTGACYRLAFFLTAYLQQQHGITVKPVVGYSNDGTGPIMASHAWIEFEGKKTDISVTLTEDRDALPPGPLLILDRPLSAGAAVYAYHLKMDEAAIQAEKELASHSRYATLAAHKKQEHTRMTAIAQDNDAIMEYLNGAPDGWSYQRIASVLNS